MPNIKTIFLQNKAWVEERLQSDKIYFSQSSRGQHPNYLWIGCSDSRVLPNEITGTSVGDLFVHRNIANLVHADDLNLMSVVTYAIEYLKIKDVIICGHYGCGGIQSAMGHDSFGIIDGWLKNIKTVKEKFKVDLEKISDPEAQFDKLVDFNVIEQVEHLKKSDVMVRLVQKNPEVRIHGWVYDMRSGYIKNLIPTV